MKIKFLILVTLATLAKQEEANTTYNEAQEIYFNGKHYEFEVLLDGVNNLRHMLYDLNHDRLYYVYFVYNSDPTTRLAYMDITNNNIVQIADIKNPRMVTKDYIRDDTYVGAKDGIYKMFNNGTWAKSNVKDNVIALYVKDVVYYVNVRNEAFLCENGDIDLIPELTTYDVENLIIDRHNEIFFLSYRRLHKTKMNRKKKAAIVPFERHIVKSLSMDVNGHVYACAMDGVFVYDRHLKGLRNVSDFKNVQALTFNARNEPILSYADKIIKLKEKSTQALMVQRIIAHNISDNYL